MTKPRDEARALFRNAILTAAEEVFAERGFHGARIQDVAERARIAVGTIYNHFGQKEDVLRALLEEHMAALVATLAEAPEEPRDFAEKLTARIARSLGYIARHRGFFALAVEHGLLGDRTNAAKQVLGNKPLRHVGQFRTALTNLVGEGIEAKALEPMDTTLLMRFLGSAMRMMVLDTVQNPDARAEEDARVVVDLFLHGAQPRGPRRRRAP